MESKQRIEHIILSKTVEFEENVIRDKTTTSRWWVQHTNKIGVYQYSK
jgi:hypothetical protein